MTRSLATAILLIWLAGFAFVALATAPAGAAPQCGPAKEFLRVLAEKYEEAPVARGLSGDLLLLILTSDEGTWTVLTVTAKGVACMVASGDAWEGFEPVRGDPA